MDDRVSDAQSNDSSVAPPTYFAPPARASTEDLEEQLAVVARTQFVQALLDSTLAVLVGFPPTSPGTLVARRLWGRPDHAAATTRAR